jgi:hypothetical protein
MPLLTDADLGIVPERRLLSDDEILGTAPKRLLGDAEVTMDLAPPPGGFASLRAPTPEEAEPVRRGYILPVARNVVTGDVSLAVPGFLRSAATLPGDVYTGETPLLEPDPITGEAKPSAEVLNRSGEVAGLVATGTLAGKAAAPKAAPPPPPKAAPEPKFAGNINLDNIYAPEEVKQVIRDTAAANRDFTAARRGVISHAETREMASLLGMTPEKLAKRVEGQAFNAEEMLAARELLVTQATKVRDLAKVAQGGADVDKLKFAEELTRLVAIQEQVAGATAEAGRTLSQFRMMAGADKEQIARLVEASKAGGLDDILGKVAELDDPAKVARFASTALNAKTSDMLLEAWINALLSGPTTHATNILSNTLVSLWSIPETAVAAGISKITSSGIRGREALARVFGFLEGARDGIRAGWRTFRTEEPSDPASKIEVRKYRAIPSVKVGGVELGGKQVRIPGRLLMAEDEFFKAIGYRQEINALAMRKALAEGLRGPQLAARVAELKANPTEEMSKAAHFTAAKQTFTNPLGRFGQHLTAMTREIPALRIVMPFIRTPVNIVKFAAERSPFAPLFKEVRANLSGANGAAARDTQIARITLGSAVSAAAVYSAMEGAITGGGPADPRQRALKYASGWQPYSVRIGDNYYSYGRLEPLGMLLGVAADFAELAPAMTDAEQQNIASLILGSVQKNLVSKTWLRGLAEVIEAFQDPDRYGPRYIQNLAGTLVPTAVAQYARSRDPYLREARSVLDKIRERLPGLRETLPMRRDVLGRPIKLEGALGPDLLSPIYQSRAVNDPVIAEMIRLKVSPQRPSRKIRDVELDPAEYDALQEATGRTIRQGLQTLISNPAWGTLPDEAKSDFMEEVIRKSRDVGRATVLTRFPNLALRIAHQKHQGAGQWR